MARISLGGALAKLAYSALMTAAEEMRDAGTFTFIDSRLRSFTHLNPRLIGRE